MVKLGKTYDEQFTEAIACTTKEEATAWLEKEIASYEAHGVAADEARRVILGNLGYMAGYYEYAVREKVYELFGAEHPIFGRKQPTAQEAFDAGLRLGEEIRKKKEGV